MNNKKKYEALGTGDEPHYSLFLDNKLRGVFRIKRRKNASVGNSSDGKIWTKFQEIWISEDGEEAQEITE